uniref:Leucine aminopeptidase 3 n=1 Tax=Cyprinus carpio TaxID=7962 RepID=A0A8C1UMC7_CYPCA
TLKILLSKNVLLVVYLKKIDFFLNALFQIALKCFPVFVQLEDLEVAHAEVDPCGDGLFEYDELKTKKNNSGSSSFLFLCSVDSAAWQKGVLYGNGQNLARQLMEAPANHITPTVFTNTTEQKFSPFAHKVAVHKRPQSLTESEQMGAFLSVSTGSEEPPIFLELHYKGSLDSAQPPLVLVGTGITFDSGGISLKPSSGMDAVRADMSGRALDCPLQPLARLISGLAPLCENMPSGKANKPDDVVRAKNGKTIQVFSSCTYCAMDVALGSAAAGMFTNSDWLWERLHKASIVTGDRVWRMPLFQHYTKQITESALAYLNNIGKYNQHI